tara:strand:- start:775 stop:1101 length:327 start_codon:yes stop_codon:yes gene_type:complete
MTTITENTTTIPDCIQKDRALAVEKRKAYMRDYKKKNYNKNTAEVKDKNKQYYYKYKFGLTSDDMAKYGTSLPVICRIRKGLAELEKSNAGLIEDVLQPYLHLINQEV